MPEAEFLLELEVVALDAPAHLDDGTRCFERDDSGKVDRKYWRRLGVAVRPFDEQPFFRARAITVCGTQRTRAKREASGFGAFAPFIVR